MDASNSHVSYLFIYLLKIKFPLLLNLGINQDFKPCSLSPSLFSFSLGVGLQFHTFQAALHTLHTVIHLKWGFVDKTTLFLAMVFAACCQKVPLPPEDLYAT